MNTYEWPRCIKSARQKRRLVKTDRDKQLIQLDKRHHKLLQQKKLLPTVPLEHPYQRGWKRFFVLRDDIRRGPKGAFYETLLVKINTVEYHPDRSFKQRRRRKVRYRYAIKPQTLREFDAYSWQVNKMDLTDEEKICFTCVETFDVKTRQIDVKYVLTEPWRYVFKVAPHIVTHVKLLDVDIERELSYITDHIDNYYLLPRINMLTRGRSYRWKGCRYERVKYINKLKNIPRYSSKETYLDLAL
ncbi:hypothetical protein HDF24_19250 [Mucilaginibacter sp. X4EP1]|uniref:hypothetical protein n=1 Tax=Mucilaginibacter sp. X4EP1 TaxID=2723092 RepID=UPI0021686737|nr:hypothetical protein [Mucilaginibacter sp. X4EP1]MCS3813286.1 putative SprT family Zn-dependent metalloprotease [Mucilaginibacter sp. X4EP1]